MLSISTTQDSGDTTILFPSTMNLAICKSFKTFNISPDRKVTTGRKINPFLQQRMGTENNICVIPSPDFLHNISQSDIIKDKQTFCPTLLHTDISLRNTDITYSIQINLFTRLYLTGFRIGFITDLHRTFIQHNFRSRTTSIGINIKYRAQYTRL